MLSHITISNYTIVSTLEMEFHPGMTVITGETGAGKSIILAAVDPCYCCTERMAVAVASASGEKLWGAEELIRMSREKTFALMEESGWRGPAPPDLD